MDPRQKARPQVDFSDRAWIAGPGPTLSAAVAGPPMMGVRMETTGAPLAEMAGTTPLQGLRFPLPREGHPRLRAAPLEEKNYLGASLSVH